MALADQIRSVLADTMNLPPELLDYMVQYQAQNQLPVGAQRAPMLIPTGTTGATAASRLVGATTGGFPTSGTFQVGDVVVLQTGGLAVCTAAGSPGTWALAGAYGQEVGYDQITAAVNVTGTSLATATSIIAGSSHTFDGSFVMAEFFSPAITTPSVAGSNVVVCLFEGSTCIAELSVVTTPAAAVTDHPGLGRLKFTPSAGAHTYSIKAFASSTTGTPSIQAGAAGSGVLVPAYLRFTKV